jgi:hypothetical protein
MQYIPISLGEKQNLLFKAQPKAFWQNQEALLYYIFVNDITNILAVEEYSGLKSEIC